MKQLPLLILLLAWLAACESKLRANSPPRRSTTSVARTHRANQISWRPLRPTWVSLPERAPTAELAFFEHLTRGFENIRPHDTLRSDETPSREVIEAARFVRDRLPRDIRWHDPIWAGLHDVANGRLPVRRLEDIEPSSELIAGTNPYLQYDALYDRLVYIAPGARGLELRGALVYALAERAHLQDLARLADVPPHTLALTYRICSNLRAEFKVVTYLQAMQALVAWARVDPDFHSRERLPAWATPFDVSPTFSALYPSFELLVGRRSPDEQRRELLRDAIHIASLSYPTNSGGSCGRYVISQGTRRGCYLLPSDDLPELIPILNEAPGVLTPPPPSAPSPP